MKIVVLIPARGGSKGIPRKNLINLCGKPLLYYAISECLRAPVHEVWVSTEDHEIADFSSSMGAKVLNRPYALATDTASSDSVLEHFASHVEFDVVVLLQATSPLIVSADIARGLELVSENFDSAVSVTETHRFVWTQQGPLFDVSNRPRRQDKCQEYQETGGFFVTTRAAYQKSGIRVGGRVGLVEIPKWRAIDIDNIDDLKLAELVMSSQVFAEIRR